MSDFPMPQPGPEHEKLMGSVGTWNVACKYFMAPGQPPMESTATDKVEAIGGFHVTSEFSGSMMGAPFVGRSSVSFDPMRGKYVTTWMDSMMPNFWYFEGGFSDDGKVMDFEGKGPDMTGAGMCDWKIQWEFVNENEQIIRMFVCSPAGDFMTMENNYTRA